MEENILYEEEVQEQPKKRKTMLTVLCILSFIGGLLVIGQSAYTYFTLEKDYPKQAEALQNVIEQLEDNGMDSGFIYNNAKKSIITLKKTKENLTEITLATILLALVSLFGVFMMFKLKRDGFYVYTFANLFAFYCAICLPAKTNEIEISSKI